MEGGGVGVHTDEAGDAEAGDACAYGGNDAVVELALDIELQEVGVDSMKIGLSIS